MYSSPYYSPYNQQTSVERIDRQIAELQKMKEQLPQTPMQPNQPAINQTFQLAPTNQGVMRFANTIDEVGKELVFGDTPFFSKDLSVMWLKNAKGDIKSYELREIIQKDEKDIMIESLQAQIMELRKGLEENAKSINANVNESSKSEEPTNVSISRTSKTKSK